MSWKEPTRYVPGGFVNECMQDMRFERYLAKLAESSRKQREYRQKVAAEKAASMNTAAYGIE